MNEALKQRLAARALEEGFSKMGICAPDATPETAARLRAFLEAGYHGQMGWMAEREGWRGSAAALWPEARSVIMLAEVYSPEDDPLAVLAQPDRAGISVYAQGKDYHDLVKRRLKRLGRWLLDQAPEGAEIKVFVDTAPVMEKPLAQAAGLGWQGKHTNLLARDLGSWFFLGAIFTTLDLPKDPGETSHCGSCRACLDACPTHAFPAPYQLDARRCISYLTIDHNGPVDPDLRALMGNRIYGCDDCLAACPWNKLHRPRATSAISPASARQNWPSWRGLTIPPSAPDLPAARSSASGVTALSAMYCMPLEIRACPIFFRPPGPCGMTRTRRWPRLPHGPSPAYLEPLRLGQGRFGPILTVP